MQRLVLVLLVTFDLWVSLVSVFLCLFLDLVVFCFCWLAGHRPGCQVGPAPAEFGGVLCPPAQPHRLPQVSRRSDLGLCRFHPCCPLALHVRVRLGLIQWQGR